LKVRERGSAPIEEAYDGSIPLSPMVELGATIGAAEFGTAVEDSGLEACATVIDGAVAADIAADDASAATGPAGSADASLTAG